MSYPYSILYLEAHRAIQGLTQAFPDQRIRNVASAFLDSTPATIGQNPHEDPHLFNRSRRLATKLAAASLTASDGL
jgi:hypothetical protein